MANSSTSTTESRWRGKTAVVIGATGGIGSAVVLELLNNDFVVVGIARDKKRLQDLQTRTKSNKFHTVDCDVSDKKGLQDAIDRVDNHWGGCDILIYAAGVLKQGALCDPDSNESIMETLHSNMIGVIHAVQSAFNSMKRRKVAGHIILMNSMAGHTVPQLPDDIPLLTAYAPSKFSITAMTEVYRQEFRRLGTKVKITSISPGAVRTDMFPDRLKEVFENSPLILNPEDIPPIILNVLHTPRHVQIQDIILQAV